MVTEAGCLEALRLWGKHDLSVVWCLGRGRVPTLEMRLNMLFTARPPLPGFPHPAPPVLAGSALSGCDIHPDEEGAPPARGAGGAARRDLPAWASAPRPSRRTGTRGRSGSRPRLVPPQPRAAARRSPPPAGRRAAPVPATTAATFPAPPPLRFGLRSPPRPAPLGSPHLTGSAAAATASSAPLLRAAAGTARLGPARPVGRGAVRYGTVRYRSVRYGTVQHGATGRKPPLPAALIPARGCHSAPLTAAAANGKPPPGAAPRPLGGTGTRGAAECTPGGVSPRAGRPPGPPPV